MIAWRRPTLNEIRDVARLAAPIVLVQVGLSLMGTVDAAMVGRVSSTDLAAVGLGNLWWVTVALFGAGVIMAIDPVVAQALGAGDMEEAALGVQRGLLLAVAMTVVVALCLWPTAWVLRTLGQPEAVIPIAAGWVRVQIPSTLPFFVFVAMRQSLQAQHVVKPVVVAVLLSNALNVFLNWVFIFGHLGVPPLGALGASISTTIGRYIGTALLIGLGWSALKPLLVPWRPAALHWHPASRMLRIGVPIGIHQFFEIVAFGGALALIGLLGTVPLAGHEITISIASLTYMVPLGVSAAAAVLVGRAIGEGDGDKARREASAALVCGVGFMGVSAILLAIFPGPLGRLFTPDPAVLAITGALIPLAALFQLFDGVQGVSSGILRGAGDTHVAMYINVLAYAVVGLPLGAYLCFRAGYGATGMWWGLVVALVVAAAALGWRVRTVLSRRLVRVRLDASESTLPLS